MLVAGEILIIRKCREEKKGPTIAISGPPGGGKTTYAARLAKELGLEYYSAGKIFREIARERGLTLEELNRIAMKDPSIDYEIDSRTIKLGCRGGLVIDGHLVAWVLGNIADVRVYVTADVNERVKRIARREKKDINDVYRDTIFREHIHYLRFLEIYGIDITNLSVFNLVVDTTNLDPDTVYSIVKKYVCSFIKAKGYKVTEC